MKSLPLFLQFSLMFSGVFSSAKDKCYFLCYIKQLNVNIGNFITLWKNIIYSFTSAENELYCFLLFEYVRYLNKKEPVTRLHDEASPSRTWPCQAVECLYSQHRWLTYLHQITQWTAHRIKLQANDRTTEGWQHSTFKKQTHTLLNMDSGGCHITFSQQFHLNHLEVKSNVKW